MEGADLMIAIGRRAKEKARAAGESVGDEGEASEEREVGYGDVEDDALADMEKALGLKGEDAETFRQGLADYVEACVERRVAAATKPKKTEKKAS